MSNSLQDCINLHIQSEILINMSKELNVKNIYEYMNCLERLLITRELKRQDYIKEYKPRLQFFKELRDKNIRMSVKKVHSALKGQNIQNIKAVNLTKLVECKNQWSVNIHITWPDQDHKQIHTKNILFNTTMSHAKNIWLSGFNKNRVAELLLRYNALIGRGQQWAVPLKQYQHLKLKYHINYEGFASPLNYACENKYCSLYKEDRLFGSIGNFFDICLYDADAERNWMINPPFIEVILDKTANKILKEVTYAEENKIQLRIICIFPTWEDMQAYDRLNNSPRLRHKEILKKKKHYYESGGRRQVLNAETTLFVFDTHSIMDGEIYYKNIAKYMKC
jgi:hypothetical protein